MRKELDRRPTDRRRRGLCAEVGEQLRELRMATGLSQVLAAEAAGIGVRQLVRIEQGANPTLETIEVLAATYGARGRMVFEPKKRRP